MGMKYHYNNSIIKLPVARTVSSVAHPTDSSHRLSAGAKYPENCCGSDLIQLIVNLTLTPQYSCYGQAIMVLYAATGTNFNARRERAQLPSKPIA